MDHHSNWTRYYIRLATYIVFHNLTSVSMHIRSFHSHRQRKGNYHSLTNAHCVPGNMVRFLSVLFIYSSQSPRGTGRILQISKLNLSCVWLFETPWIAARQASLSITISWSSLRLMYIESVMPSSHLILCCPRFLLPSIPPRIRVFSNESTLRMRWPKY